MYFGFKLPFLMWHLSIDTLSLSTMSLKLYLSWKGLRKFIFFTFHSYSSCHWWNFQPSFCRIHKFPSIHGGLLFLCSQTRNITWNNHAIVLIFSQWLHSNEWLPDDSILSDHCSSVSDTIIKQAEGYPLIKHPSHTVNLISSDNPRSCLAWIKVVHCIAKPWSRSRNLAI